MKKKNNFVSVKEAGILFLIVFGLLSGSWFSLDYRLNDIECTIGWGNYDKCKDRYKQVKLPNVLQGFEPECIEYENITHEEFVEDEWDDSDCFEICWDWADDCDIECIEKGCRRDCARESYRCKNAVYEKGNDKKDIEWMKLFIEGECITGPYIRTWTEEVCVKEGLVRNVN